MFHFHIPLSPSPVHLAFSEIQWNSPIAVSNPEKLMLQSAEENPLEYTLAEYEDAFLYTRLLLKVLDQVTGPSGPGSVSQLPLEQAPLKIEEAHYYYEDDKTGVVTHYIITKLYEMIGLLLESTNPKIQITTLFYQDDKLLDDWRPLLRLLYRGGTGDAFSQRGAALCLAHILKAGCGSMVVEETLQSLVSWLTSRLQSSHSVSLGVVTPTLVVLASCPPARLIFDQSGGIGYLTRHLRQFQQRPASSLAAAAAAGGSSGRQLTSMTSTTTTGTSSSSRKSRQHNHAVSGSVQQLYELCFCLWTMTYDVDSEPSIRQHFHRDGAVTALAGLLISSPREKVTRLALSSLRNLAQVVEQKEFVQEMIGCGVQKSVKLLLDRQWTDPDIIEDLQQLNKILQDNFKELSRWEVYLAELETGRLEWGILHTEKFFRENARYMEGPNADFAPLKKLIQLLRVTSVNSITNSGEEDDILAIACFDLGEFIRHYPNGKSVANRLGAKALVMPLMEHENQDVQRQALQCISKMLVQNWKAIDGM